MVASTPKVALVYDKVSVSHGGAERVLTALQHVYPTAPLFTSVYSDSNTPWTNNLTVLPSFLQSVSWLPMSYRLLVPFFPLAFESLDLSPYDIIISITSGEAKGVLTKPDQLHVCYLLTPPRYLYSHSTEYLQHPLVRIWPIQQAARMLLRYLRWWDRVAATRPDHIIPISNLVAQRIKYLYYREPKSVLYPPVPNLHSGQKLPLPDKYVLSVSRLVPYKHVELSIQACVRLRKKLLVVGTGIEQDRLQALAKQHAIIRSPKESASAFLLRANRTDALIYFLNNVTDSQLTTLYSHAVGLAMPGIEDFGISALEAAACGTPTILHTASGVAEILSAPKHSIMLPELTVDAMIDAVELLFNQELRSGELQKIANYHTFSYFCRSFKSTIMDLWLQHKLVKESI